MDFFDINQLDLKQIQQYIEMILAEWNLLVEDVPTEELPKRVYLTGTAIALGLWLLVTRILPSPLGRITWIALFAILCSPTVNNMGDVPQLVPASVAVVYGVLTKNTPVMLTNGTIILSVFAMGLFIAFLWERIKAVYIGMLIEKQKEQLTEQPVAPINEDIPNLTEVSD